MDVRPLLHIRNFYNDPSQTDKVWITKDNRGDRIFFHFKSTRTKKQLKWSVYHRREQQDSDLIDEILIKFFGFFFLHLTNIYYLSSVLVTVFDVRQMIKNCVFCLFICFDRRWAKWELIKRCGNWRKLYRQWLMIQHEWANLHV